MDFKAQELWNSLGKALPCKFHGSGGHNKQNRLQNRVNFHRSQAWQIVRIYNTACIYYMCGCIAKGRLIFSEQGACAEKHWPKCLQLTPTHIYLYFSGHDEEYIPISFALFCCDISVLSGFMSSNYQTFFRVNHLHWGNGMIAPRPLLYTRRAWENRRYLPTVKLLRYW